MNMKKSIAGVMAGAMAVSAMAAVVSADQDAISLTYDLKTYVNNVNKTKAKVTVVANYEGSMISKESVEAGYITFGADNAFITGGDLYNENGVKIAYIYGATQAERDKYGDFRGKMTDFEFTARPYKDIPNEVEEKYQTFKATNDAKNIDGAYYDKKNLEGITYNMKIEAGNSVYGKFDITKYDLYALGYSVKENADAIGFSPVTETTYAVRDAVAKMTYEIPNCVSVNQANGWGWGGDYMNWNVWPAVGVVTEEQIDKIALEFFGISTYGDATMTAELFAKGFWTSTMGVKKGVVEYDEDNVNGVDTALVSDPTTVAIGAFTAGAAEEAIIPFKSTLNPGKSTWSVTKADGTTEVITTKENDVVWALQNRKAGGNYYTKPVAVINDAIANHTNVTFTFTSYDGYVGTKESHILNQWVNVDQGYGYQTSSHDWHNPTFGQHLYTNIKDSYSLFDSDDYDMYGSYSSAWGINLFTGAVVVNNQITMQLSDVDTFNWGSNTLTFDWFDITDDGKITDAKTFLTTMLLYTPVDWYWDKLTVVVTDEEREDIDAGAGLEDEAEVIEDEPEVEEPEIVEEPEVVETEAAPVETAPSPATGNAPVALAVIPVALAAAAVVAKKRG